MRPPPLRVFTFLSVFCGIGAGARGFLDAQITMFDRPAAFRSVGGIDNDPRACEDFEYLTDSPALCADIARLTPAELRAFCPVAPDVVFASPPCKGYSALLSTAASKTAKYRLLNRLVLDWAKLMVSTWEKPPRLFLLENVPRIASRGKRLLSAVKAYLRKAGYVFHAATHDCGELGGLAQHRQRFLLVARRPDACAPLLYQPIRKRVRGCGEVIGPMPMPEDPAGGPMHKLPRLSWLNWVRLALIPAGGDWRDLNGVLEDGQVRREVFRRHHVGEWNEPVATVAGSGSNGPSAVADPRIIPQPDNPHMHWGKYKVGSWTAPAQTVIGAGRVGSGAQSVADPRVRVAFDHGYAVLRWDEPSSTIAGGSSVGQGAYSIADVRFAGEYYGGTYGVMGWQQAASTITGNARSDTGRFSVADPRKPPPEVVIILAEDGTWHRPLTTLELAALQGLPTIWKGAPLQLAGTSQSGWRERIGNAVPPPTARAIAEQMLVCLVAHEAGSAMLSNGGALWVERGDRSEEAALQ